MEITRSSIDTGKGPDDWFTGDVYIDAVAAAPPPARVFFEPDENHWHGATPNRFMAHLAINEVDDEHELADWGNKVTDQEYAAAPREG
jgi:hypothetical protein